METEFNIATGVFTKFNDSEGIMICGYEWGGNADDLKTDLSCDSEEKMDVQVIFSNKIPYHGERARKWKYDQRVISWFSLWGHPLRRDGTGGDFEKCLLQTNWCDTQNKNMDNDGYSEKLLAEDQVHNFIKHVARFKPRLILFFGTKMIDILQSDKVLNQFKEVMGPITEDKRIFTKPFEGRKFKVGFQAFERCKIICLPHPSGSHGIKDDYIKLFSTEIGERIQEVKHWKTIA